MTRVDATFSARRNSVATSRTVGKMAKSSGLTVYTETSRTISPSAMLKVNTRSSTSGGSGSTIMASIITSSKGVPSPISMRG